ISISFLLAGICIIGSSSMQALGHGIFSLLISFARQLLVLLPAAYLLAQSGVLGLVWWSFPIAEVASVSCTLLFLTIVYRRDIRPMMNQK
ncbi:MAG: MATE family efflux transporter, partial [Butyricicoccaceae bacterium]